VVEIPQRVRRRTDDDHVALGPSVRHGRIVGGPPPSGQVSRRHPRVCRLCRLQVRSFRAPGAIPPAVSHLRCLQGRSRARSSDLRVGRVEVPADGVELPDRGHASHDGQVSTAADLGRHPARIALHPDVSGFDRGEHGLLCKLIECSDQGPHRPTLRMGLCLYFHWVNR
jgi:hypothetical protein